MLQITGQSREISPVNVVKKKKVGGIKQGSREWAMKAEVYAKLQVKCSHSQTHKSQTARSLLLQLLNINAAHCLLNSFPIAS